MMMMRLMLKKVRIYIHKSRLKQLIKLYNCRLFSVFPLFIHDTILFIGDIEEELEDEEEKHEKEDQEKGCEY